MSNLSQEELIIYIICLIIGLILCFFGLHLVRFLTVITGLALGGVLGAGIAVALDLDTTIGIVVSVVVAVVFGVLFFFLRRVGMFFLAFILSLGTCALVLLTIYLVAVEDNAIQPSDYQVFIFIGLGISLVIAILAAIFMDPLAIIATCLMGGSMAGMTAAALLGINSLVISYVIQIVLIVLGILFQFWRRSRKIGKEEAAYAEQIRRENSVESEIEQARSYLDDDEEDDEDEDN